MYAETGLFFPYMQNFAQDMQQLEDYCNSQKPNVSMGDLVQTSMMSEYDFGGEGDLFRAPEPIIEEPALSLDPATAAMSIISCGEDVMTSQGLKDVDIESFQNEQFLSEVFFECEKDLRATTAMESPLSEVLDIKTPVAKMNANQIHENKVIPDVQIPKSVSSGCLSAMEWVQGATMKPNFMELPGLDFAAYGMRRAYSEGDIKTLCNGNLSHLHSPPERPSVIISCSSEDRKEKLSRYRNKKTRRNFGRKIKYACRKALADSQPRVRGRFAKTEESDAPKKQ